MSAEADALYNPEYGQVSDERVNHRNQYRPCEWDTRADTLKLAVSKPRRGTDPGGRDRLPARGLHPPGRETRRVPRRNTAEHVPGQWVRLGRRTDPEGPRSRPHHQRPLADRGRRQRRPTPRAPWVAETA
nr:transposase [Actinacidiphila glaucinigra]